VETVKTRKADLVAPVATFDGWRVFAIMLAFIGMLVAGYMAWAEVTDNETACVDVGKIDCSAVQDSAYAETFGIPVALLGLAGYVAILAVLLLEDQVALLAAYGRTAVVSMALFGVLFQTYLTYIEGAVLDKWCQWCVASFVVISLLLGVGIYRLYAFLQPLRQ